MRKLAPSSVLNLVAALSTFLLGGCLADTNRYIGRYEVACNEQDSIRCAEEVRAVSQRLVRDLDCSLKVIDDSNAGVLIVLRPKTKMDDGPRVVLSWRC